MSRLPRQEARERCLAALLLIPPSLSPPFPSLLVMLVLSARRTLSASGGSGTYAWSITLGSLPAGLLLDSSTYAIAGTPTTARTYTITADDSEDYYAEAYDYYGNDLGDVTSHTTFSMDSRADDFCWGN